MLWRALKVRAGERALQLRVALQQCGGAHWKSKPVVVMLDGTDAGRICGGCVSAEVVTGARLALAAVTPDRLAGTTHTWAKIES